MKKSISILLLLCMLIGMFGGVSAFAAEGEMTDEAVEVNEPTGEEVAEDVIEEPTAEEPVKEELIATEEELLSEVEEAVEALAEDGAAENKLAEEVAEVIEDGVQPDYTLYLKDGKVYKDNADGDELNNIGIGYENNVYTFENVNFATTATTAMEIADTTATITLVGSNTIQSTFIASSNDITSYGILARGNGSNSGVLTINGSGSLNVTAGSVDGGDYECNYSYGILCEDNLTINSGTITATGGSVAGSRMSISYGISCWNHLTINGGTITATGGSAEGGAYSGSEGIQCQGIFIINSGTITATGNKGGNDGESYGILSSYSLTINGGTITASSSTASCSYGIKVGGFSPKVLVSELVEVRSGNVDIPTTKASDAISHKSTDNLASKVTGMFVVMENKGVTVNFDSQNGSTVNKQTILSGAKATEPTAPTKTGYVFGGWYKEAAYTNKWDFATDTVSKDITLYAKWLKDISACTIEAIANQTYTGSATEPELTVKDGDTPLTLNTDYTVDYTANTNAGTATATITGTGNYTGTNSATFTINAKNVTDCAIEAIANQTYTGSAIEPTLTVKNGTIPLTKGTDYTVAYTANTNAGTATATITGTGNYTGTNSENFTINAKAVADCTVDDFTEDFVATGEEIKPAVTVKSGDKTLTENTDYTLSYKDNTNAGTATVTISGTGNYSGSKDVTFTIVKLEDVVEISKLDNYTEKAAGEDAVVTLGEGTNLHIADLKAVSVDDKELVKDTDYKGEEGCIKLTLYKSYLNTIAAGKHTLTAELTNGVKYETDFTVKAAPAAAAKKAPSTGDNNALGLWIGIASISVIAMGAVLTMKRKEN